MSKVLVRNVSEDKNEADQPGINKVATREPQIKTKPNRTVIGIHAPFAQRCCKVKIFFFLPYLFWVGTKDKRK
jgi:hypothetical protein